MNLTTGRRLNRNHWTLLPIPQDVIDRVHTLIRCSNTSKNLQFTWRDGTPIEDVAYDESDDNNDEDYEYTASPDDEERDDENNDDDNDNNENENNEDHENDYYNASDNTTGIAGVMDDNEEVKDDEDKNENELNTTRARFKEDTIPEAEPEQNADTAEE